MPDTELVDQLKSRIRDLELTLGQGDTKLAGTFRLTPVLNNLFGLLLALPIVTPEMIRQRMEIAPEAKVAINRLRKNLAPRFGEDFIKSKRNVGYWIEPADKATVKAILAGEEQETPVVDAEAISGEHAFADELDSGPEDGAFDLSDDAANAA